MSARDQCWSRSPLITIALHLILRAARSATVAIVTETVPGGDFSTGGSSVTTTEYTLDGVAAVRYEVEPVDEVVEP